jgi:hypothetical protein
MLELHTYPARFDLVNHLYLLHCGFINLGFDMIATFQVKTRGAVLSSNHPA